MSNYVLGFAFTKDYSNSERVLLIRKTKPQWQAGLNGVGGKIELEDVSPHWAMVREFTEETGVRTLPDDWRQFAILKFPDDLKVHCFANWVPWTEFKRVRDTTEEHLEQYQLDLDFLRKMREQGALTNLLWLIPMARAACETFLPVLIIQEHEDIKKVFGL